MDIFGKMAMIFAAGLAAGACARQEFTMVTRAENVTIKAGSRSVKVHIPASSLSTVVI